MQRVLRAILRRLAAALGYRIVPARPPEFDKVAESIVKQLIEFERPTQANELHHAVAQIVLVSLIRFGGRFSYAA